ncbi:MAG: hypothetical protein HY928_16250 [Elusimicrobia bacterium]|nr:hypothetical protein [Elusimicrobiota bacterium]
MPALPLMVLLLPCAYAAASFGTADGVLALQEAPGWETSHPEPPALLSLRRGAARFSAEAAADDADLSALVTRAARAVVPTHPPGVERAVSAAGLPYALASRPVAGRLFAAAAVDRVRYLFEFRGVPGGEARSLLDSLHRQGEAPPDAPGPSEGTGAAEVSVAEAVYFEGAVRLGAPAAGRMTPHADGWVVGSMATWRAGVSESKVAPLADSPREAAEASIQRRSELLVAARRCKGGDVIDHPLANGWTVLERPFACPDAVPGSVTFVGAVAREGGRPLDLAGDYASAGDFDAILAWLGTGTDRAASRAGAPLPEPAPRPRSAASVLALALGAAGLAGLGFTAFRQRAP